MSTSLTSRHNQDRRKSLLGKDILNRMSQLEELSRRSSAPSRSKALVPKQTPAISQSKRIELALAPTNIAPLSKSSALARPRTPPNLSVDTVGARKATTPTNEGKVETPRDSASPISHSPTWPVRGRPRHKRSQSRNTEDSQEQGNRTESSTDGLVQRTGRTRKRLSKKPPAAFATQGYAIPSTEPKKSSVATDTRPRRRSISRSRQGRSWSFSSNSSTLPFPDLLFRRGSSRPPTRREADPIDSNEPAKIESHRPKQPSKSSTLTKLSSGDEAYVKDVVEFAREMERSAERALKTTEAKEGEPKKRQGVPKVPQLDGLETTGAKKVDEGKVGSPKISKDHEQKRRSSSMKRLAGKQDNAIGGYKYPNFKKLLGKQKAKAGNKQELILPPHAPTAVQTVRFSVASSSETTTLSTVNAPSGYVEKHRFYYQKRSIARFEEELAVKEVTDAVMMTHVQFTQNGNGRSQSLPSASIASRHPEAQPETADVAGKYATTGISPDSGDVVARPLHKALTDPVFLSADHHLAAHKPSNDESFGQIGRRNSPLPRSLTISALARTSKNHDSQEKTTFSPKGVAAGASNMNATRRQSDAEVALRTGPVRTAYAALSLRSKHHSLTPTLSSRLKELSQVKTSKNSVSRSKSAAPAVQSGGAVPADVEPSAGRRPSKLNSPPKEDDAGSIKRLSLVSSQASPHPLFLEPAAKKPITKTFVICCKCQRWHDLPSQIHEVMAVRLPILANGPTDQKDVLEGNRLVGETTRPDMKGLEANIYAAIKCPWCEHGMSRSCCEGWTGSVHLQQRHH